MKTNLFTGVGLSFLLAYSAMGFELQVRQDVSPLPVNGPEPATRPNLPTSRSLEADFLLGLINPTMESFEALPTNGTPPFTFGFGGGANTATLSGSVAVWTLPLEGTTINGTFPVHGTNYLVIYPGDHPTNNSINATIAFSTPVAAFGFFTTDIEKNQLKLVLHYPNGSPTEHLIPVTVPQGSGGGMFCYLRSPEKLFDKIEFCNVGTAPDGFGFDKMTIGTLAETRPFLGGQPNQSDLNPPPAPKTMVLSWHTNYGPPWILQKSSSMHDWWDWTNQTPVVTNDLYQVEVICTDETGFFRLLHRP